MNREAARRRDLSPYPSPEVGGAPGSTAVNSTVGTKRCSPARFSADADARTKRRLISATPTPKKQERRAPLPSQGRGRGLGPECNRTVRARVLTLLLALSAAHSTHAAEEPTFRTKFDREVSATQPVLICRSVDKAPTIDGEVDKDPVWATCERTRGAWANLGTKEASGRQTVVYACHDREKLYLGFVCEEPELQNARFDGNLGQNILLGSDDCVEAVIELGGLQGEGQVFSFRANPRTRTTGWGFSNIPAEGAYIPEWKSAGKMGPNRWMVEMAIPFSSLKTKKPEERMAAPLLGDVVGLKLARYGAGQADPANRMHSSWNVQIPLRMLYACGYNGLLYFGSTNVLNDPLFSAAHDKSPWKTSGEAKAAAGAGLVLSAGATAAQSLTLRAGEYYLLNVKGEGVLEAFIGSQTINLTANTGGFLAPKDAAQWVLTLKAPAAAAVREASLQLQPGEEPPGVWCLTNNYRRAERNIRTLDPKAPEGSYRYVRIDYNGAVISDDHPTAVGKMKNWDFDPSLVVPDLGGESGSIPFSKGSLTGRPHVAFWQTEYKESAVGWGRHEKVVLDIDLGQDYFVRGLDVLLPAPYMLNLEVWCKPEGAAEWTYLFAANGEFVAPSKRRGHARGYEKVRELNSVARHIRWRATERNPAYPQLDGIQEFWVWGEPKGQRTAADVKAFQAWHDPKTTAPIKAYTETVDPDACLIVPQPREMEKEDGWFLLSPQTRLIVQNHPEAQKVARQIRAEVQERWQIELQSQAEENDPKLDNCIYLGVAGHTQNALRVAKAAGLKIEEGRPQGYALRVTRQHAVILGRDAAGLYYGVQSFMMAMRWREGAEKEASAPAVHCLRVRDWPGTLERGFYHRRPYMPMLLMPESEIDRIKRMCQLLSRFKYNVAYQQGERNSEIARWTPGRFTALCREMHEEYHLEFRPAFLYEESEGAYWQDLAGENASVRESDPDEAARQLGTSVNLCPLDPETYRLHFERIDNILELFDYPSKVWLGGQVLQNPQFGARWSTCRRCQKSGKSAEELYKLFLSRVLDHLQSHQTQALLRSPWLRCGDRSAKDKRLLALDLNELPAGFTIDLDENSHIPRRSPIPGVEQALISGALDPQNTANGPFSWPSRERYFHAPQTESEMLHSLAGKNLAVRNDSIRASLAHEVEKMWLAPNAPQNAFNSDLSCYILGWWFGAEYPSWRAGARPQFFALDLRRFANHTSEATGKETLEPGRLPEMDLRYLPKGQQTLGGISFDIIDPAQNGGKALLMLGRIPAGVPPTVSATVAESAGPIQVRRKAASLSFLRTHWQACANGMAFYEQWLRPVCRVVFEDGQWLVVDTFQWMRGGACSDVWTNSDDGFDLYYRRGWYGNSPGGSPVRLRVVEWINPYPEKLIDHLEFFTPEFLTSTGKRVNNLCEAIIAISGTEPTQRDIALWTQAHASTRTPLLPPLKQRDPTAVELTRIKRTGAQRDGSWSGELRFAQDPLTYKVMPLQPAKGTEQSLALYDEVYCDAGFIPFSAVQLFDKPLRLSRVEIRGPWFTGEIWWSFYAPRTRKLDVEVEYTEDGTKWVKAGALRAICLEADFLPIALPDRPLKGLRFTANAQPYRYHYHPVMIGGGIFSTPVGCPPNRYSPHFCWRLFAPAK